MKKCLQLLIQFSVQLIGTYLILTKSNINNEFNEVPIINLFNLYKLSNK